MKINYSRPGDAARPRQLFVLVNEFSFAAFPVRPRYPGMARARPARNGRRRFLLQRKGTLPC